MQGAVTIEESTRPAFQAMLGDLVGIYAAAMGATPGELPGRQAIMERHTANPGFRVLTAMTGERPIAFAYGFRGTAGQWWHDVVRAGITAAYGPSVAQSWLESTMEVAEVHVHPDFQARGIGRNMLLALTTGRPERTALLSTRDANSRARRLYGSVGFQDLLTGFLFPGGGPAYAVMGAELPLIGASSG